MPLIQIRRNPEKVSDKTIEKLAIRLPGIASEALCCSEGGALGPADIMIEVDDVQPFDKNGKDIHIRVWAHDYAERRGKDLSRLDFIRGYIADEVIRHLSDGTSWYVWVLLAPTSYGSNTENK